MQQLLVGLVELLLIFDGKTLIDASVGDVEEVDVGHLLVAGNAENVDVVDGVAHHLAAGDEALQCDVLALHFFGFLEAQFFCQLLHFGA